MPSHTSGFSSTPFIVAVPDLAPVVKLGNAETEEVMSFLSERPVHTVAMASLITDNGIESDLNRGIFYGYRNESGDLEAVALIGHSTLVDARSDRSLKSLAFTAKSSVTPINLIMSSGNDAETFFAYYGNGALLPRDVANELLFETSFPFPVQECNWDLRNAVPSEIDQIACAHAEVAFIESGIDPMSRDRNGFLRRVLRRIEQGRTFVLFEDGKLVFKADIIAETPEVIYLEGVYVARGHRRKGIASSCLAKLCLTLLERSSTVCLLSNASMQHAHKCFEKAGFQKTGSCKTVFI
ncbi:MAG: GNAT family N-acetyltransferase [Acidobacteria bacterium]|nr:GNAT family N-acetyltransferase [Acidobacteriota bacterium]